MARVGYTTISTTATSNNTLSGSAASTGGRYVYGDTSVYGGGPVYVGGDVYNIPDPLSDTNLLEIHPDVKRTKKLIFNLEEEGMYLFYVVIVSKSKQSVLWSGNYLATEAEGAHVVAALELKDNSKEPVVSTDLFFFSEQIGTQKMPIDKK